MSWSLGETRALAAKAARGVGLSWGMAEEAGFAVQWLQQHSAPGVAALADLLDQYHLQHFDPKPLADLQAEKARGAAVQVKASQEAFCPLSLGASILDGEHSHQQREILIECPLLLAPFLALLVDTELDQPLTDQMGADQTATGQTGTDQSGTDQSGIDQSRAGQTRTDQAVIRLSGQSHSLLLGASSLSIRRKKGDASDQAGYANDGSHDAFDGDFDTCVDSGLKTWMARQYCHWKPVFHNTNRSTDRKASAEQSGSVMVSRVPDSAEQDIKRLEHYAALTYAPATAASRLSGAGAGLNDND